jgi:nucleotide-binding universal stress UspA family protein
MAKAPMRKKTGRHPLKQRKRKFVVVMDSSPEAKVSLQFASARAAHVEGGTLVIFHAIPPVEFQHWMAVKDEMAEQNKEKARAMMKEIAAFVEEEYGVEPEIVIREGQPKEELLAYIEKTRDLFALFLGAHTDGDPGPLVDYFSGPLCGALKCPVVIVPGGMSAKQIDEIA